MGQLTVALSAIQTLLLLQHYPAGPFPQDWTLPIIFGQGLTSLGLAGAIWMVFRPETMRLNVDGPLSQVVPQHLTYFILGGWLLLFGATYPGVVFFDGYLQTTFGLQTPALNYLRLAAFAGVFFLQFIYIIGGSFFGLFSLAFRENAWLRTDQIAQEKKQRELEAKMFHNEKLASIGVLAAGVAHEINNPLAIIQGCAELLQLKGADSSLVDRIQKAIQRVSTIVTGLRTYARPDTDHIQALDLAALAEESHLLLAHILQKDGIQCKMDLPRGAWILGNIGKLQQVIINLLSNARDALSGRKNPCINLKCEIRDMRVILSISDNGSGISKVHQRRLFEPFFTTKAPGHGTGLGLSISQSIVRALDGTIRVNSDEGEGTEFILEFKFLPDGHSSMLARPSQPEHLPQFQGLALIADDEPEIRNILRQQLESTGLTVVEAENGKIALGKILQTPFDLLILDLRMPEMGGDELLRELEKRNLRSKLKILVITGGIATDFTSESRERIRRLADGYVNKPFSAAVILEQLTLLLAPKS